MWSDKKIYFLKNEDKCKKLRKFRISAYSVDNCGSQDKTRVLVITQITLGCYSRSCYWVLWVIFKFLSV
jgi:hypothetical protein